MFIVCWSVKGGVGTSVVSAAIAVLSAASGTDTLLVDLDGDQLAILGLPALTGPGVDDWLGADDDVPVDALEQLEVRVDDRLSVLPTSGGEAVGVGRLAVLGSVLAASGRTVVVDAGPTASLCWWNGLAESVLVTRACYLALRRVGRVPVGTSVVVVEEAGRALRIDDVLASTGASLRCRVTLDPAVARAVDAGLLATRIPRSLRPLGLDS